MKRIGMPQMRYGVRAHPVSEEGVANARAAARRHTGAGSSRAFAIDVLRSHGAPHPARPGSRAPVRRTPESAVRELFQAQASLQR